MLSNLHGMLIYIAIKAIDRTVMLTNIPRMLISITPKAIAFTQMRVYIGSKPLALGQKHGNMSRKAIPSHGMTIKLNRMLIDCAPKRAKYRKKEITPLRN